MTEVVYVPVVQEMAEERLRAFQAALDVLAHESGWDGYFVAMRCRPAKSWCCGSVSAPAGDLDVSEGAGL